MIIDRLVFGTERQFEGKISKHAYKPLQLRTIPLNVVIHRPAHFYEHEYRCCQPNANKQTQKSKKKKSENQSFSSILHVIHCDNDLH